MRAAHILKVWRGQVGDLFAHFSWNPGQCWECILDKHLGHLAEEPESYAEAHKVPWPDRPRMCYPKYGSVDAEL